MKEDDYEPPSSHYKGTSASSVKDNRKGDLKPEHVVVLTTGSPKGSNPHGDGRFVVPNCRAGSITVNAAAS